MKALSRHLLIELLGCDRYILDDLKGVEMALLCAVSGCGATVLKSAFHKFSPQGVSGMVLIAESHFSVHTWPEYNYAACDIFTCGTKVNTEKAMESLKEGLKASETKVVEIKRGEFIPLRAEKAG